MVYNQCCAYEIEKATYRDYLKNIVRKYLNKSRNNKKYSAKDIPSIIWFFGTDTEIIFDWFREVYPFFILISAYTCENND
uniref:Uncharacterized protein n=1 Tax=uncultured organism HF10_3D09 TaxID=357603 RepID=Q2Q0C8_9ZZZZ|nr:hypothetical protein [uncultured organism HF10_3D09]